MSDETTKQVRFNANQSLYDAAVSDLEHGELSERLRETLTEMAYGAETAERERVQERLETYRENRRETDAEIQRLKSDRDEWDRKIERAERRLNQLQELDGEYDGMLESMESQLHDGVRFIEGSPPVKKAAAKIDGAPADVIADLKERNPDVPDYAFRLADGDEPSRWTDVENKSIHR